MTEYERERFADLPVCDGCEHPSGHHTSKHGCWHCECDDGPEVYVEPASREIERGVFEVDGEYYIRTDALARYVAKCGGDPRAVIPILHQCHNAAGIPQYPVILTEIEARSKTE